MENAYNPHEEGFEGLDIRREAERFEERLQRDGSFYMDSITLDEVYEYYRAMDQPQKAISLLDFAINHYPANAEFYYKKSCVAFEQALYTEAYDRIQEALRLSPDALGYRVHKSRVLHALGNFDHALNLLKAALPDYEDSTDRAELYFQMGQLSQQDDKYGMAINFYSRAFGENPDYEDALFEVVFCYEMLGRPDEGAKYCQEFLNSNPYSACAWYNLGTLQHKLGEFEQAVFAFDYATIIQEEFISAYYGKANALMELERYDEAIRTCLQSLNYDRHDVAILLCLGEGYENINEFVRARYYYGKCTELYPNLPDAWYGVGSTFEGEKRYLEAIHYYKRALEFNKEFVDAWLGLADCEYFLGNEVSANEALRTAITLHPQDVEMWMTWGERMCTDKNAAEALMFLDEGLSHNSASPELIYQYSAYALQAGRSREAMTYLENGLMINYDMHALFLEYCPQALELPAIRSLLEHHKPRPAEEQLGTELN